MDINIDDILYSFHKYCIEDDFTKSDLEFKANTVEAVQQDSTQDSNIIALTQISPFPVCKKFNKYILLDLHDIFLRLKNSVKSVQCLVYEVLEEKEIKTLALFFQLTKKEPSPLEKGRMFSELYNLGNSDSDISTITNYCQRYISQSRKGWDLYISNINKINKMPNPKVLKEKGISLRHFGNLAESFITLKNKNIDVADDAAVAWIKKAIKCSWTAKELKEEVANEYDLTIKKRVEDSSIKQEIADNNSEVVEEKFNNDFFDEDLQDKHAVKQLRKKIKQPFVANYFINENTLTKITVESVDISNPNDFLNKWMELGKSLLNTKK